MVSSDLLENLAAFVPTPVAYTIYRQPRMLSEPMARRISVAVLFSDISGFTPLSELLAQAGPVGAEELTHLINRYFTRMIEIVEAYRGRVIKFSGDALIILFPTISIPMEVAVRRAAECALTMQAHMSEFTELETSRGPASLSMKVGISTGSVLEGSIGGVAGRWEYLVGGEPLVQVARAEHYAQPDDIILSPSAWAEAASFFSGETVPDSGGFIRLKDKLEPLPPIEPIVLDWSQLSPSEQEVAADALRGYVPEAIKARLATHADWLAELRRMTIVFVNIGGFDYEADTASHQLQQFIQATQTLIHHFEGSLGKMSVDDKGTILLILFGVPPFSHEDDASRAVAFALQLQAVANDQNLHMSIGITEGTVFAGPVGATTRREYTVIGDQVNLAARLMQYGRAGSIVISDRVKERAGPQFITKSLGEITVKGKSGALSAHLVQGEQEMEDQFAIRYLLHEEPLIGRQAELDQARRVAARIPNGQMQLLFVEGEPGLGKTRLVSEIAREWIMEGRVGYGSKCISYGQQIPYQAWQEVLAGLFGLTPDLPAQQRLTRLAHGIKQLEDPPGQPNYWLNRLPLLADVLSIETPKDSFIQSLSGQLRRNNTFALIEALLRKQAAQRPILIIMEDFHWADELSLSLVSHLTRNLTDSPLLLVITYRPTPEKPLLPKIRHLSYTHTIRLTSLDETESSMLIDTLLNNQLITPEARETLLHRGEGNPFFLHEIISAISDIARQSPQQAIEPATLDLPDTVQDMILTHIDRLAENEKLTLKVASVIGVRFQRPVLSAAHPFYDKRTDTLSMELQTLEQEKLIRLEAPNPTWEYIFRNIITQEVVYEGLLLIQRRQLHGAIGLALEELQPDEIEQLAFHYSRSDNFEKTFNYLNRAAQKAQREYANQVAIGYYTEILNMLAQKTGKGGGVMSTEYWDILLERARLYNLIGQRDAELEDLGTLGILAEALQDDYRRVLSAKQWAYLYETSGDYDSGLELIERAFSLMEGLEDEKLLGEIYNQWGKLLYLRVQYETAYEHLQQALMIAQKQQDKAAQADCLNNLGIVAHYQGDYEVARYFFREATDLWRDMGDRIRLGDGLRNLGRINYTLGQYSEALHWYEHSLANYQTIGDRAGQGLTHHYQGQLQRSLGNYAEAHRLFKMAIAIHQANGNRRHEAHSQYHLAVVYHRLAEYKMALQLFEEALKTLREVNDPWVLARALTYYSWTLDEAGQARKARKFIEEALKIERDMGQRQEAVRMETLAHLGRIALNLDDMSLAYTCTRHSLKFIEQHGSQGFEHPGLVFMIGYETFQALQKPKRATAALQQAQRYLAEQAGQIEDEKLRRSFLNEVPEHRRLQQLITEQLEEPQ